MRKCELWDMGQFGGTGTLLGFAGTMDEVRAIIQMESGFLCACALGGVKMLPDATEETSAQGGVPEAEPVAWIRKTDITELTDSEPETNGWTALYAAPTGASK